MNKILEWGLMALASVVITIAVLAGVNSCTENGLGAYIKGPIEPTDIETSVENAINPQMISSDEVVAFQIAMATKHNVDSIFLSMSEEAIRAVSTVLLRTSTSVTVQEIVNEYTHPTILNYNNLPSSKDTSTKLDSSTNKPIASVELVKEEKTTVTEAPPTRVNKTTTTSKDTVVDGKKVTITTTVHE